MFAFLPTVKDASARQPSNTLEAKVIAPLRVESVPTICTPVRARQALKALLPTARGWFLPASMVTVVRLGAELNASAPILLT